MSLPVPRDVLVGLVVAPAVLTPVMVPVAVMLPPVQLDVSSLVTGPVSVIVGSSVPVMWPLKAPDVVTSIVQLAAQFTPLIVPASMVVIVNVRSDWIVMPAEPVVMVAVHSVPVESTQPEKVMVIEPVPSSEAVPVAV